MATNKYDTDLAKRYLDLGGKTKEIKYTFAPCYGDHYFNAKMIETEFGLGAVALSLVADNKFEHARLRLDIHQDRPNHDYIRSEGSPKDILYKETIIILKSRMPKGKKSFIKSILR